MIMCICASPALDLTYRVERLRRAGTNRVRDVAKRPGGKAVNVASLLHILGEDVLLLTTAGGDSGADLAAALKRDGIPHELVTTTAATRRTVAIVDDATDEVTMLNEPARLDEWPAFRRRAEALISTADVVVISGALPGGAPADAFAQLTTIARAHDCGVVLDTSGPALPVTLSAGPTMVKPNAEELRECTEEDDPVAAAIWLAERWHVVVVASMGAEGLIAVDADRAWRARPAQVLSGNPTGAGDAVVAGLARGLCSGTEVEPLLADCVSLGAAAVLAPSAGEIDLSDYRQQVSGVVVESLDRVAR